MTKTMDIPTMRVELRKLAEQVVRYLDGYGYKLLPPDDEMNNDRVYFRKATGQQFALTYDWRNKDRVNVETWTWPSYTYTENGQERSSKVTPSDLYSPRLDTPSISVAVSRGAETIAKEISRRFIPDYEAVYARCLEKARVSQKAADEARDGWEAIARVVGKDPKRGGFYLEMPGVSLDVENRNGKAFIKFYATAEQLEKVIAALKGDRNG